MLALLASVALATAKKSIVLMPLMPQGGLGAAWAPLMMEHLSELGLEPLYPPALEVGPQARACKTLACYEEIAAALGAKQMVAGTVIKQGGQYYLTLTLHDALAQKETRRVERNWIGRDRIEPELRGAARDLIEGVALLQVSAVPQSDDPLQIVAPVEAPPPRFRAGAIALISAGAVGVAAGTTLFVLSRVWLGTYALNVSDYNAQPRQPQDTFELLQRQHASITTLSIASYVTAGAGIAALAAGIGMYVAGASSSRVTLAPSPGGATVFGRF